MKHLLHTLAVVSIAIASFTWLTVQAEPVVHAQRRGQSGFDPMQPQPTTTQPASRKATQRGNLRP